MCQCSHVCRGLCGGQFFCLLCCFIWLFSYSCFLYLLLFICRAHYRHQQRNLMCVGNPKGKNRSEKVYKIMQINHNGLMREELSKSGSAGSETSLPEWRETAPTEAVCPSCRRKLDGLGGKHSWFLPSPAFSPAPELKEQPQTLNFPHPVV